jgi:hypothetical protein
MILQTVRPLIGAFADPVIPGGEHHGPALRAQNYLFPFMQQMIWKTLIGSFVLFAIKLIKCGNTPRLHSSMATEGGLTGAAKITGRGFDFLVKPPKPLISPQLAHNKATIKL